MHDFQISPRDRLLIMISVIDERPPRIYAFHPQSTFRLNHPTGWVKITEPDGSEAVFNLTHVIGIVSAMKVSGGSEGSPEGSPEKETLEIVEVKFAPDGPWVKTPCYSSSVAEIKFSTGSVWTAISGWIGENR